MSLEVLLLPFQFPFMRDALLIAAIVAVPTALLSCFLVLKGWALMGDAVSHAVLPGVVVAFLFNVPILAGAFAAGMVCALSTGYLSGNSRVKHDTVMAIVFSGMFALGIVLQTAVATGVHLDQILFGNMLGVDRGDLLVSGTISLAIAVLLLLKWRDFLLHAFDPIQARVSGLSTRFLHYGLLAALSLSIVATLSSIGIVLAVALLITPGATAFLVARDFRRMMIVAVAVCLSATIGGTYLSFFIDSAPAPTIVLVLTAIFVVAFARRLVAVRRQGRKSAASPALR